MYEHIIVPFDGTAAALAAALAATDLSERFGAELVLATAADLEGERAEQFKAAAMARSDARVTVWVEPARRRGRGHRHGDRSPTQLAHLHVHQRPHGGAASRVRQPGRAPAAQHRRPVLLFGPNWQNASLVNLRNVIVCVDGTPTAEAAIPLAASWAQAMPLTALVLHVDTGDAEPAVDLARLAFPLEHLCAEVERVTVPDSRPVEAIVSMARSSTASMLVMATHARSGFDRLWSTGASPPRWWRARLCRCWSSAARCRPCDRRGWTTRSGWPTSPIRSVAPWTNRHSTRPSTSHGPGGRRQPPVLGPCTSWWPMVHWLTPVTVQPSATPPVTSVWATSTTTLPDWAYRHSHSVGPRLWKSSERRRDHLGRDRSCVAV